MLVTLLQKISSVTMINGGELNVQDDDYYNGQQHNRSAYLNNK